jgi:SAM-dependent methyltransferase
MSPISEQGLRAREFYAEGYGGRSQLTPAEAREAVQDRSSRVGFAVSQVEPGSAVLDLGCGQGAALYGVRRLFGMLVGADLVASEVANTIALLSESKSATGGVVTDANSSGLPFRSESFDTVMCLAVIEFVFDPERVLGEVWRVLKPGGRLVGSIGNVVSLRNRVRCLLGRAPFTTTFRGAANGGALHQFGPRELGSLLGAASFVVDSMSCSGRGGAVRRCAPKVLGDDIQWVATKVQA